MVTAEDLAKEQRSISVAEFFEKNKHILGFDSPSRGIITTVKEAVDNALDACEEAMILPDIFVSVQRRGDGNFRITVEDNGPGIVPAHLPYVFGKLLYGSRFHQIRQSRGQQGIGISAAVLYAQLTSGTPTEVISRTGPDEPAHRFLLNIDTRTNEPVILSHEEVVWDRIHGTRVEIEFPANLAAKRRLLDYLRYTSVVNSHARIHATIGDEEYIYSRASDDLPAVPRAIDPHPHGIELGTLVRMAAQEKGRLREFLTGRFSRVGPKTAREILNHAGMDGDRPASSLTMEEYRRLLDAMQEVRIPPPPASLCLSPIGQDLIVRGLEKEFRLDFVSARTRSPSVATGHPFVVEAALGYGGSLPSDGAARLMRFANRVPLLYQQGACLITSCVTGVNWKSYGLAQQGLPQGPVLILVHLASTNVPFTSESKDAIAPIPEIAKEITLALQELGRDLRLYLRRREKKREQEDRARAICSIIPEIAMRVGEIVERPPPDTSAIEGRIMRKVVAKKYTGDGTVHIEVVNHTSREVNLQISYITPDKPSGGVPPPDFMDEFEGLYTLMWRCRIPTGGRWTAEVRGSGAGRLDVRGVDEGMMVVVDLDV